uniref:Ubiquitin-like domain-containing protein n=1 Tax=Rhizochromulina marina TaxID=1034831 RepID=A0A7S2SNT8_9STRA|mmetsp:Transcript_32041/g.93057  ORF Transcript_32041/g.93057 Transcript_32041/m.93057 type:complete len:440 (+) Transcript_32041:75-1394(+)
MAANEITVKVKRTSGEQMVEMTVAPDLSVQAFKEAIQAKLGVDPAAQRLIHKGKILKDDQGLDVYKVATGETVLLQVTQRPAAAGATPSGTQAPVAAAAPMPPTAAAMAGTTAPTTGIQAALEELSSNPPDALRLGLETLLKVIDNIIQNPNEDKYRRLRPANATFNRKVGSLPGGLRCVREMGFTDGEEEGTLILAPSTEAWHHLNSCRRLVQEKLDAARRPVPSPFPGALGSGAGMPFAPPFGGMPGGMPPGMDFAQMSQLASDPNFIRQAVSNPMVQQMAAGNPMLQQQIQALQQNPQMLQQAMANPMVQQMMQNPEMMQNAMQMMGALGGGATPGATGMPGAPGVPPFNPQAMQQMMGALSGANLGTGGMPSPPFPSGFAQPSAAPSSTQQSTTPAGTGNATGTSTQGSSSGNPDEGKTEEELINEAIQRSLQEQ